MTPAGSLENPILNSPYEPPGEHFVLGPNGPTGEVKVGRRPSESYIPVPVGRRRRGAAQADQAEQESLEGWDTNTVTHILGIRRFGSQLLCEHGALRQAGILRGAVVVAGQRPPPKKRSRRFLSEKE